MGRPGKKKGTIEFLYTKVIITNVMKKHLSDRPFKIHKQATDLIDTILNINISKRISLWPLRCFLDNRKKHISLPNIIWISHFITILIILVYFKKSEITSLAGDVRVRMIFSKFFEGSFTHIKNQMIFFYMKWLQLIKTTLRWQKRIQQLKVTITCVNVKKIKIEADL